MTKATADEIEPPDPYAEVEAPEGGWRLARHVSAPDADGQWRMWGPEDVLPDVTARVITNPRAFADPCPPWARDPFEGLDRDLSGLTVLRGVSVPRAIDGRELPLDGFGRPPRFGPRENLPRWAAEVLRETHPDLVVSFQRFEEIEEEAATPEGPWLDASRLQPGLVRIERSDGGAGLWAS